MPQKFGNFQDEGDMTLKTDSKFVPLNNPQMVNSSPFPPAGEN